MLEFWEVTRHVISEFIYIPLSFQCYFSPLSALSSVSNNIPVVPKTPPSQSLTPECSRSHQRTSINSSRGGIQSACLTFSSAEVSFAVLQLHRMCPVVSLSTQMSHLSSVVTFHCFKPCLVGRMFLPALHIKCLILLWHFKFHIAFHRACILELSEHSELWFFDLASLSIL